MNDSDLDARMGAVERLVHLFRLERIVHLVVTTVSLVMLLSSAAIVIFREEQTPAFLAMMFGSSGLITYSANRLLRMWNQALQVLMENKGDGVGKDD